MNESDIYRNWQHRLLYTSTYAGIPTIKAPTDFWMYQELVYEYKPDVIIEIGNHRGGMLVAFSQWMRDIFENREYNDEHYFHHVYGIDIDHSNIASRVWFDPWITLITGDAIQVVDQVKEKIYPGYSRALVIEDSSHTYENTLGVLNTYCDLIQVGGYFIVEDTICHHGLDVGPNPGPMEAVEAFLKTHRDFIPDRSREAYGLSWNPKGYLKRLFYD